MKRLLLLLSLLALASCGYPSKLEADSACDEWVTRGGEYFYLRDSDEGLYGGATSDYLTGKISVEEFRRRHKFVREKSWVRRCEHEVETRQYLGWDSGIKAGTEYTPGTSSGGKIVRRFRY